MSCDNQPLDNQDPNFWPQALRSGAIATPYQFVIPGNWKEAKIPNALTGNYCMPKCGEPWVEAIFENNDEGRATTMWGNSWGRV